MNDWATPSERRSITLVIDIANVLGSVPDGWWRDRAGATEGLLAGLSGLVGSTVTDPDGHPIHLDCLVAVLEGRAKLAGHLDAASEGLVLVRAVGSGDDAIAEQTAALIRTGAQVLVVTADRGLRARLPVQAGHTGPGWLNRLLGRHEARPSPERKLQRLDRLDEKDQHEQQQP